MKLNKFKLRLPVIHKWDCQAHDGLICLLEADILGSQALPKEGKSQKDNYSHRWQLNAN